MTLDAAYGDLLVKFSDDVLYLEYGDLKAKALVKDLPELIKNSNLFSSTRTALTNSVSFRILHPQ